MIHTASNGEIPELFHEFIPTQALVGAIGLLREFGRR
jgi:hypothetical protein